MTIITVMPKSNIVSRAQFENRLKQALGLEGRGCCGHGLLMDYED